MQYTWVRRGKYTGNVALLEIVIFFGFFDYLVLKSESVYKRCCYASVSDKSIIVDSYQQICLFSKKLGDYLIKIYCHPLESFFFVIYTGNVWYFLKEKGSYYIEAYHQ